MGGYGYFAILDTSEIALAIARQHNPNVPGVHRGRRLEVCHSYQQAKEKLREWQEYFRTDGIEAVAGLQIVKIDYSATKKPIITESDIVITLEGT